MGRNAQRMVKEKRERSSAGAVRVGRVASPRDGLARVVVGRGGTGGGDTPLRQ